MPQAATASNLYDIVVRGRVIPQPINGELVSATASYATEIAAAFRVDMNDIPISALFDESGHPRARREINRAIDEIHRAQEACTQDQLARLNHDQRHAIENAEKNARKRILDQSMAAIRSEQELVTRYNQEIQNCTRRILTHEGTINSIEKSKTKPISEQLEHICSQGFWTLHHISENGIVYLTTPNIVLTHKQPEAGIDLTVPMGAYRAKLSINERSCWMQTHKDNINVGGTIHPFFPHESRACFGNLQGQADAAILSLDIERYFALLQALITTYNHENRPYATLASFAEIRNQILANAQEGEQYDEDEMDEDPEDEE